LDECDKVCHALVVFLVDFGKYYSYESTPNLKKTQVADFREQIAATFQLNEEKKEIDFFHKFFPVSLVEKIIAETNAYAVRCIQDASSFRFINIRWVKTLKFAVIVVRIKQRIPFISHCLQQRARLFIHFHSYIKKGN
jgi:hypothetical protein